jgi:hypothetical protein
VKLGRNASDTYAILSKAYSGEATKNLNVSEWHKWFRESSHVKITNEDNLHHFSISGIPFTLNSFQKAKQSNAEVVMRSCALAQQLDSQP